MDSLNQHAAAISLVLAAVVILLTIWIARINMRSRRVETRLAEILGGVSGNNTAQMLVEYLQTVRSTAAAMQRMQEEHQRIVAIMPSVVRHVGLVRFSPFHDTGGDQSFALALLDGQGDGVVVTGLHSRNDSRLYAKPIERGSSSYSLTPEERNAMEQALHARGMEARR
jgi:Protein of unknown function (DUF4446)